MKMRHALIQTNNIQRNKTAKLEMQRLDKFNNLFMFYHIVHQLKVKVIGNFLPMGNTQRIDGILTHHIINRDIPLKLTWRAHIDCACLFVLVIVEQQCESYHIISDQSIATFSIILVICRLKHALQVLANHLL